MELTEPLPINLGLQIQQKRSEAISIVFQAFRSGEWGTDCINDTNYTALQHLISTYTPKKLIHQDWFRVANENIDHSSYYSVIANLFNFLPELIAADPGMFHNLEGNEPLHPHHHEAVDYLHDVTVKYGPLDAFQQRTLIGQIENDLFCVWSNGTDSPGSLGFGLEETLRILHVNADAVLTHSPGADYNRAGPQEQNLSHEGLVAWLNELPFLPEHIQELWDEDE